MNKQAIDQPVWISELVSFAFWSGMKLKTIGVPRLLDKQLVGQTAGPERTK